MDMKKEFELFGKVKEAYLSEKIKNQSLLVQFSLARTLMLSEMMAIVTNIYGTYHNGEMKNFDMNKAALTNVSILENGGYERFARYCVQMELFLKNKAVAQ